MSAYYAAYTNKTKREGRVDSDLRLRVLALASLFVAILMIVRLLVVMVFQHDFYTKLAQGSHEMYAQLFPLRGQIFVQDSRSKETFAVAVNKYFYSLFADSRQISSEEEADDIATRLGNILQYDDEKKLQLFLELSKRDDPYVPIEAKVTEQVKAQVESLALSGIHFVKKPYRIYPEHGFAAQTIGFLGKDEQGHDVGRYGIEGYHQDILDGEGGFVSGARAAGGGFISFAGLDFQPAQNGSDITLTIDRGVQDASCTFLREAMEYYESQSASLVIMEPQTGAIRAMCSLPDFDLNEYSQVDDISVYNNSTIFTPYEPGSVFKPIPIASAVNEGLIGPETYFYDTGKVEGVCEKPIQNADQHVYEDTDMTGVLIDSINTGMVHTADLLGKKRFLRYIEDFGFGVKTGVGLDTEAAGNIQTLSINSGDDLDCYGATASFGQGITVTPLQLAAAYSAIANGGYLPRPYVVESVKFADGKQERTKPEMIRQVLESQSASLTSAMLVSVIDGGHGKAAGVPGYYVAGKTGTAQIPGKGGYTSETIHSFVGFAPIENPRFVLVVKLEKPQRGGYSSSTAAPTFGKIVKFLLQYYRVPPTR
ncbi:penicillin-binding protein 2 [Candidatus Nomurabacteria bacterium]|nr:penicillin-binding protein 2 [Candidatus Nomurabacteria bacterium]